MTIVSNIPIVSQAQAGAALRALALSPGQVLEGRVLGPGEAGTTIVQVGRQAMALALAQTMQPGTLVTLGVQQAEGGLRLALIDSRPPHAAATQPQLPATSVEISQRPPAPQGPLTYAPPANPAPAGAAAPAAPPSGVFPTAVGAAVVPLAATGAAAIAGLGVGAPRSAAPATPASGPTIAPPMPAAPTAGPVLQRPGASPYGLAGAGAPPSASIPVAPTGGALSPPLTGALAQMVQQALPGQASLGALTGLLAAASKAGLPEPVLKAARQILGNQLVPRNGKVDAAALKAAVGNSGIFQEANLAGGAPASAAADTKSGLLAMRQGLAQWLGADAQIAQVSQIPPPLRHVLPRARLPDAAQDFLPTDVEETGRLLLERTEGALSRLRLHQHASLPEAAGKAGESQWSMDFPVAVGTQQAILNMQIHHDSEGDAARPEDRGWQVRFAINLPALGEVGAQVSLRGTTTGIMLWADREDAADAFSGELESLRTVLESVGLTPGALVVRRGAPGEVHAPTESGHYLDATR